MTLPDQNEHETEVERLREAIRTHRDTRGDDRCWQDDEALYKTLPEGFTPPERDTLVMLENCIRYVRCRQNPATVYVSPEQEIKRLRAQVTDLQEANTREVQRYRASKYETTSTIDGKFVIKGGQIVKASSGEIVPDDEPLMLMRARDRLVLPTLQHYRNLCVVDGCNEYQLALVDELIARFAEYSSDPSRMKQPGVTRGAAWTPETNNA